MIIFDLKCEHNHSFEGWFKNAEEYAQQVEKGQLTCPICDSANVFKIPSVSHIQAKPVSKILDANQTSERILSNDANDTHGSWLQKIGEYVEKHFDDVGPRFAEEAKRIYYRETEARNIKGTASLTEIRELSEEGITTLPVPQLFDKKKLN